MSCLDQIVLENERNKHLAIEYSQNENEPPFLVMHATAITPRQLIAAFKLVGALKEEKK